jgi:hypothetical protein
VVKRFILCYEDPVNEEEVAGALIHELLDNGDLMCADLALLDDAVHPGHPPRSWSFDPTDSPSFALYWWRRLEED